MLGGDSLFLWVTMVEMPVLAGLFWLVWRNRRDGDAALADMRKGVEVSLAQVREALSAYKLEVAKSYASIAGLKEVEGRLTAHLLRIETKLDDTRDRGRQP